MANVKLEDLSELTLASSTLLYGEKTPYTALADAGKIPLSLMDARYLQVAGDTMAGNLDMDDNLIQNIEQAIFNLTPVTAAGIGQLQWNNTDGTLEIGVLGGTVVLQIGQESHVRGVNKTGITINNGESVTLTGAQGTRPKLALTDADDSPLNDSSVGLATEDIANNAEGYVTTFGLVRDLDTSAFAEGDRLWGTTTPGVISNVPPNAPGRKIFIGTVLVVNANNGSVFVSPVNVPNLSALSDVFAPSPSDGDYLRWSSANSRWELSAT
jgi:hypothetical protein